jgi:hypothetical protein
MYQQATKHFGKLFYLQDCRPYSIPVKLNGDNMEINIVAFNVPAMLESLSNDKSLNCYVHSTSRHSTNLVHSGGGVNINSQQQQQIQYFWYSIVDIDL